MHPTSRSVVQAYTKVPPSLECLRERPGAVTQVLCGRQIPGTQVRAPARQKGATCQLSDPLEHKIDDLGPHRVVTAGVVVCGVFLPTDELLRVEE